jgi:hypothetical protein
MVKNRFRLCVSQKEGVRWIEVAPINIIYFFSIRIKKISINSPPFNEELASS